MVSDPRRLAQLIQLERIARIRADRELTKFAAFSAAMQAQRGLVAAAETALRQSYDSVAPMSVPVARMANVQAGRAARDWQRAVAELTRMTPRYERARQEAAREFGRAEALSGLRDRQRPAGGTAQT